MRHLVAFRFVALAHGAAIFRRHLQPDFPVFEVFVKKYKRSYLKGTPEFENRRSHYEARVREATDQNAQPDRLWTADVNYFWDWTHQELQGLLGNRDNMPSLSAGGRVDLMLNTTGFLKAAADTRWPEEISWAHLASMKKIRDQGYCGSCWAVAATTLLEAHAESRTGMQRTFSAQQIVSCMPNPRKCGGDGGCTGASVELALQWVSKHGCAEEHEIPYRAEDTTLPSDQCPAESASIVFATTRGSINMQGWERLPQNQEGPLVNALVNLGPVAVSVAGSDFYMYSTGIFNKCVKNAILSHAVVLIGYGVKSVGTVATKYWTLQNSWGSGWGEQGYMRMLRHDDEQNWCGIDDKPELGNACQPYPEQISVCGTCGILYSGFVPHLSSQ